MGIQLTIEGEAYESGLDDMPSALVQAGWMANKAGADCYVILDGEPVALVRPHRSHAGDGMYARMTDMWLESEEGRTHGILHD